MLIVCFNADLNIPCSQSQCSSWHICSIACSSFLFFRTIETIASIINPKVTPIKILINNIFNITWIGAASEISIGSISSDVDKNIAISVPSVIILPAYKLEATAEKPHCGTTPKIPPHKGPSLPDFLTISFVFPSVLCSIYSINK